MRKLGLCLFIAILALCASFQSLAAESMTVAAFGDSLTRGWPRYMDNANGVTNGGYTPNLQALLDTNDWDATVLNYGYPGEYVGSLTNGESPSDGAFRLKYSVLPTNPTYTLILEGTNDLGVGIGPVSVKNILAKMISSANNAQTIPIIATLVPRFDGINVTTLNGLIRTLAEDTETLLADIYNTTSHTDWPNYIENDGLHLTATGDTLIAPVWFAALQESIKKTVSIAPIYLLLLSD